jgi:DNA-directed RNA polymerase-3 subunit RPC5
MDADDENDPVVAEYDVYITPENLQQQLYILQYLNRPPDQPFTKATDSQPSELRIKENAGFLEVDVPINLKRNYNRVAGVRWGEAMRKTKGFGQKAFGIASGFERTMPRSTNRAGGVRGPLRGRQREGPRLQLADVWWTDHEGRRQGSELHAGNLPRQ